MNAKDQAWWADMRDQLIYQLVEIGHTVMYAECMYHQAELLVDYQTAHERCKQWDQPI